MNKNFMKTVTSAVSVVACQLLFIGSAQAGPMTGLYELSNHPDGGAEPPLYGLRLDGLLTGGSGIYTFDFDHASSDMKMSWDGSVFHIYGQAWGGKDTGSSYGGSGDDAPRVWDIDFSYVAGTFVDTGDGIQIQNSSDGAGSLNNGTISSDLGTWDLVDVGQSTKGYTFQFDTGHRGETGLSGWGWVNHCESSSDPYSGPGETDCDVHHAASDWLFTAEKIADVPEPGALLILALGLLGMGGLRKSVIAV